jgi:hypothetical protein
MGRRRKTGKDATGEMNPRQIILLLLAIATLHLEAQIPQPISPAVAAQIVMQRQPPADSSALQNISVTAEFDPPVICVGEKSFYRVSLGAIEHGIRWPEKIPAPAELQFGAGAHGQLTQPDGTPFRPLTSFLYEVTATAPGQFTVPEFAVPVETTTVNVPAATLQVTEKNSVPTPPARRLVLEISATNLFEGQPVRIRVLLPADGKKTEGVRDLQFNGGSVMTDKTKTHLSIGPANLGGQLQPAFICETVLTPLAAGPLTLSVQGFTAPPFSVGPISITSSGGPITLGGAMQITPEFLVSDAVNLRVLPLPVENALSGFTGAFGKFLADKPILSTNRVRVGEPVHLKTGFHGAGDLTRFVPPAAPRVRDWQIIADKPPASGFTFIPQTDAVTGTPAIPFCAFDPETGKYYDLTIPALPITVVGDGLPTQLADAENQNEPPPKLSGLAATPGPAAASLQPLQLQGWFVLLQILPVYGLFLLWQWDQRRRFWGAHPDLYRRHLARRALRREKRRLAAATDAPAFARQAVTTIQIAVAPHFPARPDALVGSDVLAVLGENEPEAATVRKLFAAQDARFAAAPETAVPLPAWRDEVFAALKKLEEKL